MKRDDYDYADDLDTEPETAKASDYHGHVVYRAGSRPVLGLLAGAVAAAVAAGIWAALTINTGYQIGFVSIGVGYLVGYAVRYGGNSTNPAFGVYAAVMAVAATVIGNAIPVAQIIALETGAPLSEVLAQPLAVGSLLIAASGFLDVVFYALAGYFAYRTSYRRFR